MNKKELVAELSNITGITQKDTENVINSFVNIVIDELKKGEQISIAGFGIFKKVDKLARMGINPSTGAKIDIAAKSVPKFVAAKVFKDSF
ncbi:MAG: HU family DNA-binding protein [Mycoplasmataceae bacterium]|nr:HU family DNA-binding protein [Mycoplasmataceae bacterium]